MKAKVSRASGSRGALNYVFDLGPQATHLKQAELVGGNMAGHAMERDRPQRPDRDRGHSIGM